MTLNQRIQQAVLDGADLPREDLRALFFELRDGLETGVIRAAEPDGAGGYAVHAFVKQGILLGFKLGELRAAGEACGGGRFFDKDTMAVQRLEPEDGVRLVPGGSALRAGAYVGPGVTIMPPAYVNIGAYVDADTMIDSHALVGSCAQVGKRVHLSAAAQLGGVLEPIGAMPVVIEDDVMVGGNCGVYEGVIVRQGAVLATGTLLNASTVLYDLVHETVHRAAPGVPLEVPAGAVVVPGARMLNSSFAREHGLALQTPVIVKYRDQRTDARTALEGALRHVES